MDTVYYIPVLKRDALCCIICDINPDEVEDSAAKSFFHWQTLKCRYLVNLMKDFVIGSPVPETKRSIYIITTKEFYETGSLSTMVKQLNLTASPPQPVSPRAYLSCIKYTFEFVLAPQWNRIARQIYVEGRNFLTKLESNTAVKMIINMVTQESSAEDDEICVKLLPKKAQLLPMKLQDLGLPQAVITDFMNNPRGSINVELFKSLRIGVLPSLRKGKLISIFKQIPPYCPYKNWADMRRHWKNMYGYRLPETDDGIIYYDIYFPMANSPAGEHFIYPDICVREDIHQSPYIGECKVITDKFMNDLRQIMPKICTRKLQVNNQQSNVTLAVPTNERTLETPVNPMTSCQHMEKTSRLSLPTAQRLENNRQPTTPMSPTPSIMGKRVGDQKELNFNNLKKIKKIHDSKPSTSYHPPPENVQSQVKGFGVFVHPSMSGFFNTKFKIPETQKPLNIFSSSALVTNANSRYRMDMPMLVPQEFIKVPFGNSKMSKKSTIGDQENMPGIG